MIINDLLIYSYCRLCGHVNIASFRIKKMKFEEVLIEGTDYSSEADGQGSSE